VVLAVAVGLVAPTIGRSTEALRVRAEVAGFSTTFRHAREQAITTRQAYTVAVSPTNRLVTVTTGEDEVRWTRALSSRVDIRAETPSSLTVRFEPQGTSSGGAYRLSSGKIAYRVIVDPVTGRVRNQRE
jgi:Tfp pilus assembly protein FimT